MLSKFKSKCILCGIEFPAATEIHWTREDGGSHIECWNKQHSEADKAAAEQLATDLHFIKEGEPIPEVWRRISVLKKNE